jgi:hypothetical protein
MKTYSESRKDQSIGNAYDISTDRNYPKHADEIHLNNGSGIFHPSSASERSITPPSLSVRSDPRGIPPSRANESV